MKQLILNLAKCIQFNENTSLSTSRRFLQTRPPNLQTPLQLEMLEDRQLLSTAVIDSSVFGTLALEMSSNNTVMKMYGWTKFPDPRERAVTVLVDSEQMTLDGGFWGNSSSWAS